MSVFGVPKSSHGDYNVAETEDTTATLLLIKILARLDLIVEMLSLATDLAVDEADLEESEEGE